MKKLVDELKLKLEYFENEIIKFKNMELNDNNYLSTKSKITNNNNNFGRIKSGPFTKNINFNNENINIDSKNNYNNHINDNINQCINILNSQEKNSDIEEDLNSQNNQQEKIKKYIMNNNNNDGNMFLNSGNNSGFGPFSFNNDLQYQKIFDFLQDFRKEQLNENRKMMNDFKEELLYELGKIVDERNEYMENNQVNIYNYYLKFNIKYKIFIL